MAYTNLVGDGLSVNGAPLIPGGGVPAIPLAGQYYYVDSNNGSDGADGTFSTPLATLTKAISKTSANRGDVIVLKPGHAETITAANGIIVSTAGIFIIGMGTGALRPTFTFSTAAGASMQFNAANVTMKNVVGVAGIDLLTGPIALQAAGLDIDMEWQDNSASTFQAVRVVLGTAAADKLKLKLKVIGLITGGTAPVNAIRLVGTDTATINLDFYGRASTGIVEFLTTACTNVEIYGYVYNSGTTDGSKNTVDTVTGSTWFAQLLDGAAGAVMEGGSGASLTADDVRTGAVVPSNDATSNVNERDVVGSKADASVYVPGTTKSLAAYMKGHADLQERVANKAAATMVNGQVIFTVAGGPIEIMALVSVCVTGNDGTASTLQFSVSPTAGSAQTVSGASASLASALAGASVSLAGTALATAALLNANGPNLMANPGTIFCPAGTITMVVGVGSTTGTWTHYLRYKPLAVGVTVS